MRRWAGYFLALACLVTGLLNAALGMTPAPADGDDHAGGEQVHLTTRVVARHYCSPTHLRLTLGFDFTNKGARPVILYKYSSVVYRYLISRDARDALAGKYVQVGSPTVNPIMPEAADEPSPDPRLFVILKGGEQHSFEDTFTLSDDGEGEESLKTGDYVLQLQVRTWYESKALAATLRKRWKDTGTLWFEPLRSDPMPFHVELPYSGPLTNCSSPDAQPH